MRRPRGHAQPRVGGRRGRGSLDRHWRRTGGDAPGARPLPRIQRAARTCPGSTRAPASIRTTRRSGRRKRLAKLDALLAEPEVIACGEIGLDYYHEGAPHDVQRKGLIRQLEIAAARKRPILIHCRGTNESTDAWDDLFQVLEEHWRRTGLGGIMHCFGGGWEQARRSLDLGFLVSFAGNLTYPKAQPLRDVAARIPLDACPGRDGRALAGSRAPSRPAQRACLCGPNRPDPGRIARREPRRNCRRNHGKLLSAVSRPSKTWETDR